MSRMAGSSPSRAPVKSSAGAGASPSTSQASSIVGSPEVKPASGHLVGGGAISSTENLTQSSSTTNGGSSSTGTQPPSKPLQQLPEKPSMTKRLTRMFSTKDVSKQPTETYAPVPQKPPVSALLIPSPGSPPAAATPATNTSSMHPPPPRSTASTPSNDPANGSKPPSVDAPSRQSSINEKIVSKPKEKSNSKDGGPSPPSHSRYVVVPGVQGGHEHYLKSAKRQEKLSAMWWDILGAKKKGAEHPHESDKELSLMSSWVDQLKRERDLLASDKKGGPNSTATLVEKYGKCHEVVGRGAFGIVRISHKRKEGEGEQLYAVKEFRRRPEESEKKYSKRLTAEFCISSSLRHPNVIHTLDLVQDAKGDYCEVMEFCAGGDLYTLVLAAGKLEVSEADCYFKQLMRGVEYMHEMGVAHRDLKPENLLLTTHGALKITDFGNGECFRMAWETHPHMVSGLCGSAPYIAPEEYVDTEFDARAVDVWATGVIYMAMRTGRHLWRVAKKDEDEFYARYLEGRRDEEGYGPIETLHRARCRNVIYSILDPKPSRRITASQVLKSEWGREIKVCKAGEEGF